VPSRPLFSDLGDAFGIDAVVEKSDTPAVPRGMPFSLGLISPGRDDYLFSRLRALVAAGHQVSVTLDEDGASRTARLCVNGWTRVLDLDYTSGWPPPSRV